MDFCEKYVNALGKDVGEYTSIPSSDGVEYLAKKTMSRYAPSRKH